jgi:hypothetical protein
MAGRARKAGKDVKRERRENGGTDGKSSEKLKVKSGNFLKKSVG